MKKKEDTRRYEWEYQEIEVIHGSKYKYLEAVNVAVLCTTLSANKRVAHGEYMLVKLDGRLIRLVLSSWSTIVHLKQLKNPSKYEPKIIKHIQRTYKYNISYIKVWQMK
jgi:hypothetical protein